MISTVKQKNNNWAALLIGCFFMCSCENNIKTVQDLGKKSPGVEEGKNIESFLSQAGKMKAKLLSPLMLRYLLDTPRVEFPTKLHVDFYDSLTTVESQLNCKYGRYFENQNQVFLRDSVIVFNRTGDTLWCDELYWDQNKSTFFTDKKVVISQTKPIRQKIFGTGLVADQNFNWFRISKIGRYYNGNESRINIPDSTY